MPTLSVYTGYKIKVSGQQNFCIFLIVSAVMKVLSWLYLFINKWNQRSTLFFVSYWQRPLRTRHHFYLKKNTHISISLFFWQKFLQIQFYFIFHKCYSNFMNGAMCFYILWQFSFERSSCFSFVFIVLSFQINLKL